MVTESAMGRYARHGLVLAMDGFVRSARRSRAWMWAGRLGVLAAFLVLSFTAVFGAIAAPGVAGAMDQENVSTPTEVWETGTPSAEAKSARQARYTNARTQLNSNFAPIKRLTLERKSPVTRLDINAPSFTGYKKSYPGLFRD